MLCLSRERNEAVTITTPEGRTIRVIVVEPRGSKVRLGFQADKEVKIMRDELIGTEPQTGGMS